MKFEIIRGIEALLQLKTEWEELWQRSTSSTYYQSPDYSLQSWLTVAEPAGCRLLCIVGRDRGRLALIWPLKQHRRALWRFIKPLSYNSHECTDILVEDTPLKPARIAAALSFALKELKADFLDLPFVLDHSALAVQAGGLPARNRKRSFVHPFVEWQGGESWEAYYRSLSKETRKVVDKKRRRLSGLGTLSFTLSTDRDSFPSLIGTLLAYKREWCKKIDDVGAWVHSPAFEKLLVSASIGTEACETGLFVFVLKLDDTILALQVAGVGRQVDWLVAAYNPEYQQYSPGILLNEHCLRWAHARNLSVTMGPGQEANKTFWARKQAADSTSYKVAGSLSGAAALQVLDMRRSLAAAARQMSSFGTRTAIKAPWLTPASDLVADI